MANHLELEIWPNHTYLGKSDGGSSEPSRKHYLSGVSHLPKQISIVAITTKFRRWKCASFEISSAQGTWARRSERVYQCCVLRYTIHTYHTILYRIWTIRRSLKQWSNDLLEYQPPTRMQCNVVPRPSCRQPADWVIKYPCSQRGITWMMVVMVVIWSTSGWIHDNSWPTRTCQLAPVSWWLYASKTVIGSHDSYSNVDWFSGKNMMLEIDGWMVDKCQAIDLLPSRRRDQIRLNLTFLFFSAAPQINNTTCENFSSSWLASFDYCYALLSYDVFLRVWIVSWWRSWIKSIVEYLYPFQVVHQWIQSLETVFDHKLWICHIRLQSWSRWER